MKKLRDEPSDDAIWLGLPLSPSGSPVAVKFFAPSQAVRTTSASSESVVEVTVIINKEWSEFYVYKHLKRYAHQYSNIYHFVN